MFEGDPQENIKRDLHRLAHDVAELKDELMAGRREGVERFKQTAKEQFNHAREQAGARAHEVDEYVKDNPWLAMGIAAAVGAAVVALLGHTKRR